MRDRTFLAVLTAFTLTVCLLLLSSWACVKILSGVRAYVGGEGLYSKAQKNAVYFLELYVYTGNEDFFSRFEQALRVPEGDRDARIQMERAQPDWNAVRRGFVAGGNSPADVGDLIFVFRRLRYTPYIRAAVKIWTEADAEIARLRTLGEEIHARHPGPGAPGDFATAATLQVEALNQSLTRLEDEFSSTLGAGARATATTLLIAIAALSVALWATGALTFRHLLSAFAKERDTLHATIDNAPLGIVLLNAPDGRIRMGNAHAWGVLGQPPRSAAPGETHWPWSDAVVAKALAGEVVQARDLRWLRPDGLAVWLRVSAAPIPRHGSVTGAVAIFYDISEERKVEEALVRQSHELARSNADLEQFAYTTSHDLQEPLRNIALYSQLLLKRYGDRLDPDAGGTIQVIISAVDRMNALIRDLLAYSRVNNMDASPMNPVNLNQIVEWACGNLRAKVLENNAVVDAHALPTVRGDPVQLVQVFQNLIDNGIKYRSAAPPVIRICATRRGENWAITVKDNGIGIDPQYHHQVFGIFKRLHGRDVPGTGIGLALARRVVERHGGEIWVESKAGEGAAFCFTLPASPDYPANGEKA